MRAFQLVDERSLLPELFAPDELARFATLEEFYAKIEYFLARPEEREAYAARAQARVLQEHSYSRRMTVLLNFLEESLGPWQESGAQKTPLPELPLEVQKELTHLIRKLGLGPHASFEDVLARLREQSGALSDLETSLLFLDEWRKQYLKP